MTWLSNAIFNEPDERGRIIRYRPNDPVDVRTLEQERRLVGAGLIRQAVLRTVTGTTPAAQAAAAMRMRYAKPGSWVSGAMAPPFSRALRVGIWLRHSNHYSGGRLHMYQYAHSLATSGAEVYFVTTAVPRWAPDYPEADNLRILMQGKDPIPEDLDIAMTDSKGPLGMQALGWKVSHPRCRFVCLNFETANWVAQYAPEIAKNMNKTHLKAGYSGADMLLGNSLPSVQYLQEWMRETDADRKYGVMPPAINTYQADADPNDVRKPERPYAVWSARNTGYKNAPLAVQAIWELDTPFDLVTFGEPNQKPPKSKLHTLHSMKNFPDAAKYAMLRGARFTLAPSLFEGFGMVPGESLAAGTPCVVYDLPVLRWAYGDRLEYVEWNNPNAFKARVKKLAAEAKPDMEREKVWVRGQYGMPATAKRIDKLPWHGVKAKRAEACMICYATPTAPAAIEAVYPHVEKIRIAYGPVELWRDWPEGGVLDAIRAMPDPENKIEIEAREVWQDKLQMRAYLGDRIEGNYQLVLDADEIWIGLDKWLSADRHFASPRWINLWHGAEHWISDLTAKGRRWGEALEHGGSVCPHYRFSWWRPTYEWRKHYAPVDAAGKPLHSQERNAEAAKAVPECAIWHLGHALPRELAERKHRFYAERDMAPDKRSRAWLDWRGQTGDCGDGVIGRVAWEVPEIVGKALAMANREAVPA